MELQYIKPDVMEVNISLNLSELKAIQYSLAEIEGIDNELRMFFLELCLKTEEIRNNKILI